MKGMFRNAHDQQIPKLSLGVQFDQEFMEKTSETSCCKLKRADCMLAIQYFSKVLFSHPPLKIQRFQDL